MWHYVGVLSSPFLAVYLAKLFLRHVTALRLIVCFSSGGEFTLHSLSTLEASYPEGNAKDISSS